MRFPELLHLHLSITGTKLWVLKFCAFMHLIQYLMLVCALLLHPCFLAFLSLNQSSLHISSLSRVPDFDAKKAATRSATSTASILFVAEAYGLWTSMEAYSLADFDVSHVQFSWTGKRGGNVGKRRSCNSLQLNFL